MKIVVSHDLILHLIIITFLPGAQMNQLCTNAQAPKQFKLCKSCASNSATDSNRARRIKGKQELVKLLVQKFCEVLFQIYN